MSLMKRKKDTNLRKDKNRRASKRGINLMFVLIFIIQLLLPLGLHASAVGEAEEQIANIQVEEAEEIAEEEKSEEAKRSEKETKNPVPVEDEKKSADSKKVEESKDSTETEVTEGENVDEEDEGELAEDYPAIVTPAIPMPALRRGKARDGLTDTIAVDKTAKRTTGCRTFEVNLNITGELQQAPVDVVLVIDKSGSMNEKVNRWSWKTRLDYAKEAAVHFAQRVLGPDGMPGSRVSIVTFSGPTSIYGDGSQDQAQTDLDLSDDLERITSTINRIRAVGGTNTEAGFKQGQAVIEGELSKQKPNSNKVVVMLTDGLPTASNGVPYADTTEIDHTHIQRAIAAGKNIYEKDIADVFTIGLTTGMTETQERLANHILKEAQNMGYYQATVATDLDAIFEKISESLGYSATHAEVVDKIGDHFDLIESSLPEGASYNPRTREISWHPGTIADEANLTYQVVAKPDFPGGLAATNESARLTYKDVLGVEQTKDFPVPEVDVPTLIEISLTDANINLGESIELGIGEDPSGENYMSPVTGGDNDGEKFYYEWRKVGEDEVFSTAKNPKVSPREDTEYELRVTDSNGCIALATMTVRVNEKIGKISVSKIINNLDEIMDLRFFGEVDLSIFVDTVFTIKISGPEAYENIITLKDGEMESLEELAFGEYTVEEIKIDDRFLLDNINPTSFELTRDKQWVEVKVENKVNYASFDFIKVDEEGNPLKGIEFELSKEGVKQTLTTDADGQVSFNFLETGDYTLKETKTIAGFKLPTETWLIKVIRNEETGQLEIEIPDDSFLTADPEKGNILKNEKQSEFPKTGGIGGLSYIALGLTMVTTTLGLFIRKEAKY